MPVCLIGIQNILGLSHIRITLIPRLILIPEKENILEKAILPLIPLRRRTVAVLELLKIQEIGRLQIKIILNLVLSTLSRDVTLKFPLRNFQELSTLLWKFHLKKKGMFWKYSSVFVTANEEIFAT